MRLRRLGPRDVPAAAELTDLAFGEGRREERLRRYLALDPEGWFAAEDAGVLLAIGGVVRYGRFAWLGLMAVRPDRQGQGLGRAVADAAIGLARDSGCETTLLIATPAGVPFYRRLGFVDDGVSQELAWASPSGAGALPAARGTADPRAGGEAAVHPWSATDTQEVARFDAPAFGADRGRILRLYAAEFARSAWVARDPAGAVTGFLVLQDAALGPWSAIDEATAERLLDVALAGVRGPLRGGIVDPGAEALLAARGFVRTRALPRMRRGPAVPVASAPRLLAHASYAVG